MQAGAGPDYVDARKQLEDAEEGACLQTFSTPIVRLEIWTFSSSTFGAYFKP
jgi:hypothetical protein